MTALPALSEQPQDIVALPSGAASPSAIDDAAKGPDTASGALEVRGTRHD